MSRLGLVSAALGGVLGALVGYALSSGNTMLALIAVVVWVPVAYLVHRAVGVRALRRGEVLVDEMHVSVAERAGLQAHRVSMMTIALIIIVIMWPSFFNIHIVPYEVAERLYPGLGLSFAILV
ncbi:DUF2178 domain-containing protein, partial [Candidatus Bathyarchaeota archaeon]|nr:DUF2178 domain-containing protein [Candidatus Bathyarchaeota archaeon]